MILLQVKIPLFTVSFFVRILKLRGFDCVGVANDENDTYFCIRIRQEKTIIVLS